jgi:hypothetical protein
MRCGDRKNYKLLNLNGRDELRVRGTHRKKPGLYSRRSASKPRVIDVDGLKEAMDTAIVLLENGLSKLSAN